MAANRETENQASRVGPRTDWADHATNLGRSLAVRARPALWQVWLNLRVWLPVLLNPPLRARTVQYGAREAREGFRWRIELPERCWKCGGGAQLQLRRCEVERRSFEYPLVMVASALGAAFFFFLLMYWIDSVTLAFLFLASLAAAPILLWVKSWQEHVALAAWACEAHAAEPVELDMVVDQDELYLYAPTVELAEVARQELHAARVKHASSRGRSGGAAAEHDDAVSRRRFREDADDETAGDEPRGRYVPKVVLPPVPDLPPIKLAGEEDEPK